MEMRLIVAVVIFLRFNICTAQHIIYNMLARTHPVWTQLMQGGWQSITGVFMSPAPAAQADTDTWSAPGHLSHVTPAVVMASWLVLSDPLMCWWVARLCCGLVTYSYWSQSLGCPVHSLVTTPDQANCWKSRRWQTRGHYVWFYSWQDQHICCNLPRCSFLIVASDFRNWHFII